MNALNSRHRLAFWLRASNLGDSIRHARSSGTGLRLGVGDASQKHERSGTNWRYLFFYEQAMQAWACRRSLYKGRIMLLVHSIKNGQTVRADIYSADAESFGKRCSEVGKPQWRNHLYFAPPLSPGASATLGSLSKLCRVQPLKPRKICGESKEQSHSKALWIGRIRARRVVSEAGLCVRHMWSCVWSSARDAHRPLPFNEQSSWTALFQVQSGYWAFGGQPAHNLQSGGVSQ